MKKVVLVPLLLLGFISGAQTILRTRLPGEKDPTEAKAMKKGIDSLNIAIDSFKSRPDSIRFIDVYKAIDNQWLEGLAGVDSDRKVLGWPLDLDKFKPTPINLQSAANQLQKVKQPVDSIALKCPMVKNVIIEFLLDADDSYLGIIKDTTGNALASFSLIQSNKELFYDKLSKAFAALCDTGTAGRVVQKYMALNPDLYTQFLEKKEDLANTNGLAGTLKIKKKVPLHKIDSIQAPVRGKTSLKKAANVGNILSTRQQVQTPPDAGSLAWKDTTFIVHSIQIQFEGGFIENIKIFGKIKGDSRLLRFENDFPINFSTKRDFRNLVKTQLHEKSDFETNSRLRLILGEVISYDENLANYNKDYSPANQVITINALSDTVKEIPLYKDQTSRILEVQVFSDLKGADDNNPNGLIQIDLAKKLNFFSIRGPIKGVSGPGIGLPSFWVARNILMKSWETSACSIILLRYSPWIKLRTATNGLSLTRSTRSPLSRTLLNPSPTRRRPACSNTKSSVSASISPSSWLIFPILNRYSTSAPVSDMGAPPSRIPSALALLVSNHSIFTLRLLPPTTCSNTASIPSNGAPI
jgi:hypothetical protein